MTTRLTRARRLAFTSVAAAVALILINEPLFTQAPPTPQASPAVPRVPNELRDRAGLEGRIRVIVELKIAGGHLPEGLLANAASRVAQRQRLSEQQTRVLSRLSPAAHRVVRRFQTVPYIALVVDSRALAALESQPDVLRVMEDPIVRPLLADSAPIIQSDQAWEAGYDGTGTTVAILDTGVEATHPFLGGRVVAEACYSGDDLAISTSFCPNGTPEQIGPGSAAPCWMEGCYHGTHVAGIAAGNGDLADVPFSGVAKGASIMAVQVFSQINDPWSCGGFAPCLGGFSSDIIAGLERVYTVAPALNVASVNLSLGEGRFTAACDTQPYKPAIDNLRSIGVATVVASGNSGYASAMMAPACISSAVSVGATDKADRVAYFSNVAPFLSLFAPGDSITSSLPGATYGMLSGTSMATPHIAGAWALVKQAAPNADVATVLAALRQTGKPIIDTRSGSTVPRARVFQALTTMVSIPNPSPVVTALTPPSGRGGPLSLTIIGSGFNAFSVVRWNGHDRPTTVINTKKIQALISSTDLAAAGTADVTVFNPTPAGGTSVVMLFTIAPPPSLTISAPSVTTGGSETVTLQEGFGGNFDWLGLAAKGAAATAYIDYVYVGPGVTTRTWTVNMPATAGTYEFRYFLNNGYTIAATSPPITVTISAPTLTVSTQNAPGGNPVTVTVTGGTGGSQDWLALAATSAGDTTFVQWTYVGAGVTTRTWTVNMPAAAGTYEFRFFVDGGYTRTATSPPVTVTAAAAATPASLAVSTGNTAGGSPVTVTLTGGSGGTYDWLGLAATDASNTSVIQWTYVGAGVTTRSWTITMPSTGGTYEFRYFLNGSYTGRAATSPPITVAASAPPSLAVSAQSVNGGAAVTVTLTNGFGGTFDWLALAAAGASNYSYIQWTYMAAGATTSAWTVTMPATAGTYEFRYFRDGGYTRDATSAAVIVK